ncbi:MAG: response regulator transcription factor [Pedobacter sp.]|nr:MAG: response regulator transcription factor [Pedobacter sp.]
MIKIVLVENQKIMLSSLTALLERYEHVESVTAVSSAKDLLELLKAKQPIDLIITDIAMPETDGIQMIRDLRADGIEIPIIILSMLEDEKHSFAAFKAGANGYLSKNVDIDEVLFAINKVMRGERYFASELAITVLERYFRYANNSANDEVKISFNERELQVLKLIAEGLTNQEIADVMFLSRRTVEGIRQSILDKTGAKNSAVLIKYAILNGYIDL